MVTNLLNHNHGCLKSAGRHRTGSSEHYKSGQRFRAHRLGFTVLELLVTIAVSIVLAGLILPAIHQTTETSRRIQCTHHLRQVGIALHQFHETSQKLPPGWSKNSLNETAWGWASELLPYLDQGDLMTAIDRREEIANIFKLPSAAVTPPVLLCPSDSASRTFDLYREAAVANSTASVPAVGSLLPVGSDESVLVTLPFTNYVGVFGVSDPDGKLTSEGEGTFVAERGISWRQLTRGLSNVAIVSERTARRLPSTWLGVDLRGEDAVERLTGFSGEGPNSPVGDESEFDSRHSQIVNMLFADGHVQQIADSIDRLVYRQMARRSDQ